MAGSDDEAPANHVPRAPANESSRTSLTHATKRCTGDNLRPARRRLGTPPDARVRTIRTRDLCLRRATLRRSSKLLYERPGRVHRPRRTRRRPRSRRPSRHPQVHRKALRQVHGARQELAPSCLGSDVDHSRERFAHQEAARLAPRSIRIAVLTSRSANRSSESRKTFTYVRQVSARARSSYGSSSASGDPGLP
jgi:hypothetical protein